MEARDATVADAAALAELSAAFASVLTEEQAAEAIRGLQERERVLVAEDDGAVVGFASFSLWRAFVEQLWICRLTSLAVHPNARRRGVARLLIAEVERRAAALGCTILELSSGRRPDRASAHAFYPALGFHDTSGDHGWYVKVLTPPMADS